MYLDGSCEFPSGPHTTIGLWVLWSLEIPELLPYNIRTTIQVCVYIYMYALKNIYNLFFLSEHFNGVKKLLTEEI